MWLGDLSAEPDPIASLIQGSLLSRAQIDAAVGYRATYPVEMDARIELHHRGSAAPSKS
jgi:hypothetical protein